MANLGYAKKWQILSWWTKHNPIDIKRHQKTKGSKYPLGWLLILTMIPGFGQVTRIDPNQWDLIINWWIYRQNSSTPFYAGLNWNGGLGSIDKMNQDTAQKNVDASWQSNWGFNHVPKETRVLQRTHSCGNNLDTKVVGCFNSYKTIWKSTLGIGKHDLKPPNR